MLRRPRLTDQEMFAPSEDDVIEEHVDEPDKPTGADFVGGTGSLFATPDEAPRMEIVMAVAEAIRQELERERKFWAETNKNPNIGGFVQFQTFSLPALQPVMIAREKPQRDSITIVNYTDLSTLSIGLHPGIMVLGADTGVILGSPTGTSRTIRTRQALWAICDIATNIDVQEDYQ
jgi:hypothetical protein